MNPLILFLFTFTYATPEQVHLSFFGDATQMVVTWITFSNYEEPWYVTYGTDPTKLNMSKQGYQTAWKDISTKERYTYRATMTDLKPGKRYYYSVGSSTAMSSIFNFRAIDPSTSLRVCIFGDFGLKNGFSLNALINGTQSDKFDIILHIGDIAYDLDTNKGYTGDDFMNEIQPIAAYVPYQVIAGNHEYSQDFLHYKERFTMPPNGIYDDNQFWSITIGNIQIIGISSEYYGYHMEDRAQKQYNWLSEELKNSKAVWKIVLMHRPMYCSNNDPHGCQSRENTMTRNGEQGLPALEPLFNSGGVDLVFWGHQHSYERNWPVFKSKAYPQDTVQSYHNASTPVYIMTGSAGCHDHDDVSSKVKQPYTAIISGDYGYSLLNVITDSQIITEFISIKNVAAPLDKFYLTKDYGYKPGRKYVKPL